MAKERNTHGEKQQIAILSERIWETLEIYLAENTTEPFEYRFYGFLFSETKAHFTRIGFSLEWNKDPNVDKRSFWIFSMPRIAAMRIQDFR